jgi:hypothetical protein
MQYVETACLALALLASCSLCLALGALALSLRAARQERTRLVRQLIRFEN